MNNINIKYIFRYVVYLLIGIFAAVWFSSYVLELSGTTEYLDEEKYILDSVPLELENIELRADGIYDVLETKASVDLVPKNINYYNYILINISTESKKGRAIVNFYDDIGGICKSIEIQLSKKEQVLQLPSEGIAHIVIKFENMKYETIKIHEIQFRTQMSFDKWGIFFVLIFIFMGCYTTIIFMISSFCKRRNMVLKCFMIVDLIIYLYEKSRNRLFKEIKCKNKYSEYIRYAFIAIIFVAIFYIMYSTPNYDKYYVLVGFLGIGLLLIIKLVSTKTNIKIEWHNPLVLSWLILSTIMIFSELITAQKMGLVGYFNLIIFGLLYYIMGMNKDREKLIECLKNVILFLFIPCIIKCLFFYKGGQGFGRYTGIYGNSNQFATYVIVVFAVVISDINYYIEKEKFKFGIIIDIILLGFSSCFLWLTQCRTTVLAMIGIIFFEIAKIIVMRKKMKNLAKNVLIILLMVILVPTVWKFSIWTINNFSLKNSSEKVMVTNELPLNINMTVNAKSNENRIVSSMKNFTSLNQLSSQRFEFWETYLRNMNLTGHKDYLYMEVIGAVSPSHNSIIGMMYKYGIFAGIPYIIMLFYSFLYALKYFINNSFKRKNAMLPLNIVIAFIMCAMLDTMDERPFWKMLWLVYYLMIGFLMNIESDNESNDCIEIKEEKYLGENMLKLNKLEKYTIVYGLVLFGVLHLAKFTYLGVDWWKSRIPQDSIYAERISDKVLQNVPLSLDNISASNQWNFEEEVIQNQFQAYNPEYFVYNGINFVYYQDVKSKQIELAASLDGTDWEVYKEPVLILGKSGTFDDKSIIKTEVVYVAPYYYMIYIGESSDGSSGIGIAVSNDGINWTKKNVRGTFKEENVKDIHAECYLEKEIIHLTYMNDKSEIREANINVSQKRDLTQFDAEADWTTSLVSSEKVLLGSYAIEGESGTKSVWMKSESSIDLYYKEGVSKLNISGYMPLDQYIKKDVDAVNLIIKINGENVFEKTFKETEVFEIEIPIDTIKKQDKYMHIELITDADFNPKKLGGSEDSRDLSYILYGIKQE